VVAAEQLKQNLEQNRQAQERIQGMSIQPGTNGF
jgi:hypothetical protein